MTSEQPAETPAAMNTNTAAGGMASAGSAGALGTPGTTGATPSAHPGHGRVASPFDESVAAIEATRRLLHEAVVALETGDTDQIGLAYEHAAECADHIARALWFLHRLERERQGVAGGAS